MDTKKSAKKGGPNNKKTDDVWDDHLLQKAYKKAVASYQKAHGASVIEDEDFPVEGSTHASLEQAPAQATEEGELSSDDVTPDSSTKPAKKQQPEEEGEIDDEEGEIAAVEPTRSSSKRKRSQQASPAAAEVDEEQRAEAWRQYYQQMAYQGYPQPMMGLPSPAPAPVFRTPTHPASKTRSSRNIRATPRTPVVSTGKPKHPEPRNDDLADDDNSEDEGYESDSEEETPAGYMSSPWTPTASYIPPPSPLFQSAMNMYPAYNFGAAVPASPVPYMPYMPPPSPMGDLSSVLVSVFQAGFLAGQQSAQGTPVGTPNRAKKRRKID